MENLLDYMANLNIVPSIEKRDFYNSVLAIENCQNQNLIGNASKNFLNKFVMQSKTEFLLLKVSVLLETCFINNLRTYATNHCISLSTTSYASSIDYSNLNEL